MVSIGGSVLIACVVLVRLTVTDELVVDAADVLTLPALTIDDIETKKENKNPYNVSTQFFLWQKEH